MSKRIKILTPRIYEHSDFFHNAYDLARKKSLNTNELCLELSRYLVEHFDKVWKIERPRIYKQICNLQSQLQQANEIINNPDTLIFQQQQLIGNLQSQLAEKEEEYQSFKKIADENVNYLKNRILEETKNYNQDKISFAVEQLEKVKNKIESKVESIYKILDDLNIKIVDESTSRELSTYEEIVKEINNQIKQLKEGK